MAGWKTAAAELLFPTKCAFCGRLDRNGVCPACERTLPRMETALREGAGFGRCAVPLRYEGAVREALLRWKFRGARGASAGFGRLVAQCAAEELSGAFDLVTWAPVSERRLRERGCDQARLLARAAAKHWETAPVETLRKLLDNPPQSGLDAPERRGNVVGVYAAVSPERFRGARVLLIDDVITTGATLSECARVLRAAGAADAVCACLASARPEARRA